MRAKRAAIPAKSRSGSNRSLPNPIVLRDRFVARPIEKRQHILGARVPGALPQERGRRLDDADFFRDGDRNPLIERNAVLARQPPRRSRAEFRALLAIAVLAIMALAPASAEELVAFASAAGPPTTQAQVRGYLSRPPGAGPFPAVALLHSCLGLPGNRRAIEDALANWGYVALFVDDFAPRGLKETCTADFGEGGSDALGALRYLSKRPDVDPARIAVVGYSQGGDAALKIAASRVAVLPDGLRFKAAAAYYPPCENLAGAALQIPTLILVGALDEVTPAAACAELSSSQPSGSDVKLVVYPGARHCFDDPRFAGGARAFGMRLEYDAAAARQSSAALRAFLAAQLGP